MAIKSQDGSVYRIGGDNAAPAAERPSPKAATDWRQLEVKFYNFDRYGELVTLPRANKAAEPIPEKREPRIELVDGSDDMVVKKSDGTNFEVGGVGSIRSYRPGGQDQKLLSSLDREQIELAGSPIVYYPAFVDQQFDPVYMESRDTIIAQEGFRLYAQFEPVRPIQSLAGFGIDSPDEMLFNFNLEKFKCVVGQMPKVKSLVYCEWDRTWWEVIQNDLDQPFKLWTKFRLQVVTKKYQRSRTEQNPTRRDAQNKLGEKPDTSIQIY